MTTAQELINSSAKDAGILAESQQLQGDVNASSLRLLNRMLSRWKNDGVDFGLSLPLAASGIVYVDDADEEAIEISLTLRMMVRYKRQVNPALSAAGLSAFTELQAKYSEVVEMSLDKALTREYLPRKRPLEGSNA